MMGRPRKPKSDGDDRRRKVAKAASKVLDLHRLPGYSIFLKALYPKP